MTDRDVYSTIERIVRDGKRRINQADRGLVSQLLGSYQEARNTIAAELMILEEQILWSIANNPDEITEAWLRRQEWYRRLDATIQNEAAMLEETTRRLTTDGRAAGIAEGGITGRTTLRALPWLGTNPQAVEHWVAAIQPGSPLDRVLKRYGTNVDSALRREITQGLIQRRGSGNIVRSIVADVGEFIPPSDASRIVRTETMRAYRGVYKDQLDALPNGMIAGYRWLAAMDSRTCPVCLGLHGHVFEEYPSYQHIQCRCDVLPVFSPRYVPPREYETGDMWLRNQPEEVQRQVLGPSRYEVWNNGVPMRDMVRFESDPVWGGSTRLIPVKDLRP